MKKIILLMAVFLLQGCSALTSPKENPVLEDHIMTPLLADQQTGILATTAERRVVIVKVPGKNDPVKTMQLCAEPSPDAADNLVSTFRAIAEAAGKAPNGQIDAKLSGDISKSLSTTANKMFDRTQGVQVLRDGMYSLCQANINQTINSQQWMELYKELLKTSSDLIKLEIENMKEPASSAGGTKP